MSQSNIETIEKGLLTVQIDPSTNEFNDLKLFIDGRVNSLSQEQKQSIELNSTRIRMKEYLLSNIGKKEIVSSGSFLKDLLSKLNIKQNRFAGYLGIRPSNFSKVLNGERKVSFELSLILEQIFKIESDLWLRIQSKNRMLRMSKKEFQSFKRFKLKDLTVKLKKNVG